MRKEIKKIDGTSPTKLLISITAAFKHLYILYNSLPSATEYFENFENNDVREAIRTSISAAVEEARCISEEIKTAIDNFQNAELTAKETLVKDTTIGLMRSMLNNVEIIKDYIDNRQSVIDTYYDEDENE